MPHHALISKGRTILTAKMKKTRMCDFHKDGRPTHKFRTTGIVGQAIYSDCNNGLHGRCKYGSDCAFAHDEHLGFSGAYPIIDHGS